MNAQVLPLPWLDPQVEGEYLVTAGEHGHYLVRHARYENGRYQFHPAFLHDCYADTARAAFKLACNHLKSGFVPKSIIAGQFCHFTANLAARIHKLLPYTDSEGAAGQALMTMAKLAQEPVADCVAHLIAAGLIPSTEYAVEVQELVTINGAFTPDILRLYQQRFDPADFDAECAAVLTRNPALLLQTTHLRYRTLAIIEDMVTAAQHHQAPQYLGLASLLNAPSASNPAITNMAALKQALGPQVLEMQRFGVSVLTAFIGDTNEKLRVISEDYVFDQARLAGELASSQITQGRMELVDHRMFPVFRCPMQNDVTQTLTSIVLKSIDGKDVTPGMLADFCHLFNLDFKNGTGARPIDVMANAR
ncbi:hypothetical protein [Marinobacter sp.]|uniref:hypothetical protein n=1 Tax=Marinobacter sp. TaxID=50741 RepID=UPI003A91645D